MLPFTFDGFLFQMLLSQLCSNPVAIERLGVRSRFKPQELIDVQLERRLATRYLDGVIFASTRQLSITRFYQSRDLLAAIC